MVPTPEDGCSSLDAEPAETRSFSAIDALRRAAGEDPKAPISNVAEVNSLRSCILAIPASKDSTPLSPLWRARMGQPSLADVPLEAIRNIMSKVDSETLQMLACTCRHIRELAVEVCPGLNLTLHPHQRAAIRWMMQREMPPGSVQHPTLRRFFSSGDGNGTNFWGDTATGEITVEAPLPLQDFRGGLFCDEPGLGKTITSLGLILRTKGTLPEPPADVKDVKWFVVPGDGRKGRVPKLGFYSITLEEAMRANRIERATATELVRRSSRGGRAGDEAELLYALDDSGNTLQYKKEDGPLLLVLTDHAYKKRKIKEEDVGLTVAEDIGAVANGIRDSDAQERVGEDAGPARAVTPGSRAAKRERVCEDGGNRASGGSPSLLTTPHGREILRKPETGSTSEDDLSQDPLLRTISSREGSGPGETSQQRPSSQVEVGLNLNSNVSARDPRLQNQGNGALPGIANGQALIFNDGSEPSGSGGDTNGFGARDVWVQCELCSKWRCVPSETSPSADSLWCCYQHPLEHLRCCKIPASQVLEDDQTYVTNSPGWRHEDEVPGSEENIEFFRYLMSKYPEVTFLERHGSVVRWLRPFVVNKPTSFTLKFKTTAAGETIEKGGVTLSRGVFQYAPVGFGQILAEMGFIPIKRRSASGEVTRGQKPVKPSDLPENQRDWIAWQQPENLWGLVFDQEALLTAIERGGAPKAHKVFLSPATLVVVPTELVNHWREQIFWHTRGNALRVTVYATGTLSDFKHPPPPYELAYDYDIVITTFSKMSSEFKSHDPIGCSPLAQVHWLRIILDEGHTLSPGSQMTNRLFMLTTLRAERRWIMTGTPAPSTTTLGSAQLRQMQPMLSFLHDPVLGQSNSWSHAIEKQIKEFPLASRWRLQAALRRCLIRASKAELLKLPPLRRSIVQLRFKESHAKSYNHFVDLVRLNLLMTDWFDPDHNESLLNLSNATLATQTLANMAQSCNVAGNIELQVVAEDLHESLQMLADINGIAHPLPLHDGLPFCPGNHALHHVEEGLTEGGSCNRCHIDTRMLVSTPCLCMLCVDCAVQDSKKCPCCTRPYVMQDVNDPERRRDAKGTVNPNPKWAVPKQLIEVQPAFVQRGAVGKAEGYWQDTWQLTESTKMDYLIRKLRSISALPPQGWNPNAWGVEDAIQWPPLGLPSPRKAIVFTQFDIHASLLIDRLKAAVPAAPDICVVRYTHHMSQQDKANALAHFQRDPRCGVLIMDETGALGLDLSFVQHVFLMEPIANKSFEEQVVSRAHRMGAKEEVHVEVLAMCDTYEEEILIRNGDIQDMRTYEQRHLFDDAGEQVASGSGSRSRAGSSADGNRNQEFKSAEQQRLTAQQRDRNAYLKALKPVRVVTDGHGHTFDMN